MNADWKQEAGSWKQEVKPSLLFIPASRSGQHRHI
jgi:hypothetical protein